MSLEGDGACAVMSCVGLALPPTVVDEPGFGSIIIRATAMPSQRRSNSAFKNVVVCIILKTV